MGTFMLCFTVGCNVMAKQTDPNAQGVFVAVSIAASLMICIYALGTVHVQIMPDLMIAYFLVNFAKMRSFYQGQTDRLTRN